MHARAINIVSVTNAATEYISLDEAKTHLRVSGTDDDTYISALIGATMQIISDYVGYPVQKSVAQFVFDSGSSGSDNVLRIMSRVLSITSVQYYDSDGNLNTADYLPVNNVFGNYGINISLNTLQSNSVGDRYLVTASVGYEKAGASVDESKIFPKPMKQAGLMILGNLYDNRQDLTIGTISEEMPMNSKWMLNPYKIMAFV